MRQERDEVTASLLKGNTAILVLWILSEGSAAGYAIATEINRRCENLLEFKHGTLYPLLHQLERDRLISSEWSVREDKRPLRVYRITDEGRQELDRRMKAWKIVAEAMVRVTGVKPNEQQG